jgi:hypothetical protein
VSQWTVECAELIIVDLPGHLSPMVELDLVRRRCRLGIGTPNAMDSAEATGALIRRYLEGDGVDWSAAHDWAQAANALFARIDAGTTREMMWSGDTVVRWTDDAAAAADALFEGIGERC